MPRRKPDETQAITSLDAADAALVELAKLDREMTLIEICLNEDIEAVRQRADELAAPLREKRRLLEAALTTYATSGKKTLFGKAKSLKLMHGIIGFRASKKLVTLKGFTWEKVLKAIQEMGTSLEDWAAFGECIRSKPTVNKDAVKNLSETDMARIGCKLKEDDAFYYETNEETVAEKAA